VAHRGVTAAPSLAVGAIVGAAAHAALRVEEAAATGELGDGGLGLVTPRAVAVALVDTAFVDDLFLAGEGGGGPEQCEDEERGEEGQSA
jgi:hypothetical protein